MLTDLPLDADSAGAFIDAERCIAELQRGRAIVLTDDSKKPEQHKREYRLVQLVETFATGELRTIVASQACQLILTRSRAKALNLLVDSIAVSVDLAPDTSVPTILKWAGLRPDSANVLTKNASGVSLRDPSLQARLPEHVHTTSSQQAKAVMNLAFHAHVLPAFIVYTTTEQPSGLLSVSTKAASLYADQTGKLMRLSSVRIPLATADNVELTVFRERHGNAEHVAIVVGEPDLSDIVTVRLHSSCFTGDILGSMKCDCGEQLQHAISSMAQSDGGVVLYISQEGRGIGLASKLLAYQLQNQGMDTIDANRHLGFEADERCYSAAVYMLEQLGINDIHLMTNNPSKIDALRDKGVAVHNRVPAPATVNVHNARYLETKRKRAGHYLTGETLG